MDVWVGQLEHHPRAGEPEHDLAGALHARHPEHLPCTRVIVPGADRVDDVLVVCAHSVAIVHQESVGERPLGQLGPPIGVRHLRAGMRGGDYVDQPVPVHPRQA